MSSVDNHDGRQYGRGRGDPRGPSRLEDPHVPHPGLRICRHATNPNPAPQRTSLVDGGVPGARRRRSPKRPRTARTCHAPTNSNSWRLTPEPTCTEGRRIWSWSRSRGAARARRRGTRLRSESHVLSLRHDLRRPEPGSGAGDLEGGGRRLAARGKGPHPGIRGGGRRVCPGAAATSAPVDHASRTGTGRTVRKP